MAFERGASIALAALMISSALLVAAATAPSADSEEQGIASAGSKALRGAEAEGASIREVEGFEDLGSVSIVNEALDASANASRTDLEAVLHESNGTSLDAVVAPAGGHLLDGCVGSGRRYCRVSGYMIIPGFACAGTEAINGGNAGKFDFLFSASRDACGSTSCVLITNPVGHRTQEQLHIHYRHYNGGGAALKKRLEAALCGTGGWQHFSECGAAKARLYAGFPGVFSEVARAYGGGSLGNVGITAWFTTACGGLKTMILANTGCSIEHSISSR